MNLNTKQKGFTLVELLIVIVVIAILAAISIVAYNGIQNRAKTTSAAASAATIVKKAEAANAVQSSYPSTLTLTGTAPTSGDFESQSDSSLKGSGIQLLSAAVTSSASTNQVTYEKCTAPSGTNIARVQSWDYGKGQASAYNYLGNNGAGGCTAWAFVSGGPA